MDPTLTAFLILLGLIVWIVITLNRGWMGRLPRPRPDYGKKTSCRHWVPVKEQDFEADLNRYVSAPSRSPGKLLKQLKPDAPFLLQRFWWEMVEMGEKNATLVLKYDEDVNRGVPEEEAPYDLGMQHFAIAMNISWAHDPHKGQLKVDYVWEIENKWNYRSPGALEAIDYTVIDLLEFTSGPKGQKALRERAYRISRMSRKRPTTECEIRFTQTPEHVGKKRRDWPTPQDFNEAMQNPSLVFEDPSLKKCTPTLNALGLPQPVTGAFASVYKADVGTLNSSLAVKCFLREVNDQAARYKMISDFICNDDLPSTVGFEFVEDGILARGARYPVLKMEWVEGYSLQDYIDEYRYDSDAIERLATEFLFMVHDLARVGIAHGDLQHGNIIICEQGLRLVDYDGMFVPGMEGLKSNELGHRNYQHPQRNESHFGPYLDNFSAWLIYISIRSIAIDPELWSIPGCGDEHLLFRQADLSDPASSAIFQTFRSHSNAEIRDYARFLEELCAMPVESVPPLEPAIPVRVESEDEGCVIHLAPAREKQPALPDWMS